MLILIMFNSIQFLKIWLKMNYQNMRTNMLC